MPVSCFFVSDDHIGVLISVNGGPNVASRAVARFIQRYPQEDIRIWTLYIGDPSGDVLGLALPL